MSVTRTALVSLVLAGCRLPHVDPVPRPPGVAEDAVVALTVGCEFDVEDVWMSAMMDTSMRATGVIISERHVLTAAHAVRCPNIPIVHVALADGRRLRTVVERDDAMFGGGTDVARLEIASALNFDLNIPPPALRFNVGSGESETVCAAVIRARGVTWTCGTYTAPSNKVYGMHVDFGDSGAGVYDIYGQLVGIVVRKAVDDSFAVVQPIGPYWLEGT